MSKEIQIAWVAGILEGEGSFTLLGMNGIRVTCAMTDLDVLEKLQEIFGGSIDVITKREEHWKDAWVWRLTGDKATECMRQILPFMCERRTSKINGILSKRSEYEIARKNSKELYKLAGLEYDTTDKSSRQVAKEFGISAKTVLRHSKSSSQT